MDLDDALERVQSGYVVARPLWPDGVVLRWRVDLNLQGIPIGWVAGPMLTAPDIVAEDWVALGRMH